MRSVVGERTQKPNCLLVMAVTALTNDGGGSVVEVALGQWVGRGFVAMPVSLQSINFLIPRFLWFNAPMVHNLKAYL